MKLVPPVNPDPTAEELAYCAGVLDSDGYLGINVNWYKVKAGAWKDSKQPTYQPMIQVKQLDPEAIQLFFDIFGGTLGLDYVNHQGSKRPMNLWQVHSASCRRVIDAVRSYLRIKHLQADLLIELCDLNASPRRHTFVIPEIIPGEPLVPLKEAAARAGRSMGVARQCIKLRNIPFTRIPQGGRNLLFVPESFIGEWSTRPRAAIRHPEVSERMADINVAIKTLNSGKRNLPFRTPRRYEGGEVCGSEVLAG